MTPSINIHVCPSVSSPAQTDPLNLLTFQKYLKVSYWKLWKHVDTLKTLWNPSPTRVIELLFSSNDILTFWHLDILTFWGPFFELVVVVIHQKWTTTSKTDDDLKNGRRPQKWTTTSKTDDDLKKTDDDLKNVSPKSIPRHFDILTSVFWARRPQKRTTTSKHFVIFYL